MDDLVDIKHKCFLTNFLTFFLFFSYNSFFYYFFLAVWEKSGWLGI